MFQLNILKSIFLFVALNKNDFSDVSLFGVVDGEEKVQR